MEFFAYIFSGILIVLSVSPIQVYASEIKPKNIILILTDDVGYKDFRLNEAGIMPNIDKLASTGVVFERTYVSASLCAPSRFGIFSGKMPSRYGWFFNPTHKEAMPLDIETIAEQLKEKKIRTQFVGKWHLGLDQAHTPLQQGFEYFFGFLSGSHDYWMANEPNNGKNGMIWENNRQILIRQHLTEELFSKGVSLIQAWEKNERHFLVISSNAAHGPLQPTPHSLSLLNNNIPEPRRYYLGHIIDIDKGIARIIEAVRAIGQESSTMFIVTNDNGGIAREETFGVQDDKHAAYRKIKGIVGDNGILRGGKASLFDGGLRVPMIVSYPSFKHRKVTTPVNHLDIYPTLLEIFDISSTVKLDGQSLFSCLEKGQCRPTTPYFYLKPGNNSINKKAFVDGTGSIVDWPWKLVVKKTGPNKIELFRIDKDPGETHNIAPEKPDVIMKLNAQFNIYLKNTVSWDVKTTKKIHKQVFLK